MKTRTAVLVAALAVVGIPAGALAAKPAHPTHPTTPATTNASKSTVMFVLHGTIAGYKPVAGTTNGSVTLTITGSNNAAGTSAASLQGKSLTFAIGASANIIGTPTVNHRAIVKVRAAKTSAATLQSASSIFQLIDQGTA